MSDLNTDSLISTVGRFRVASLSLRLDDGRYRASVSIRSGRGSACTDRVLRLADTYATAADAHHHAHREGLAWVAHTVPGTMLAAPATPRHQEHTAPPPVFCAPAGSGLGLAQAWGHS